MTSGVFKAVGVGYLFMLLGTTIGLQDIRAVTITAGMNDHVAGEIVPTSHSSEFANLKNAAGVAPANLDTLIPDAIPGHTFSNIAGGGCWVRGIPGTVVNDSIFIGL